MECVVGLHVVDSTVRLHLFGGVLGRGVPGLQKLNDIDALLFPNGFVRMDTWIKPKEGWGNAFYVKRALL